MSIDNFEWVMFHRYLSIFCFCFCLCPVALVRGSAGHTSPATPTKLANTCITCKSICSRATTSSSSSGGSSSSSSSSTSRNQNDGRRAATAAAAFGISNILAYLRGGEVIEGGTASDVDALILKAGSSQSLVVIDFSATWW